MSTTLDFQLRDVLPHLSKNGRLNVLVALVLHANIRNRCYPSLDLISAETGFGLEAVNKAKSWLIECGAIERVQYIHRVGKEKKLPPRQNVYQLTGVIKVDGKSYAYLYDGPHDGTTVNPSDTETSVIETSDTEGEVIPSLKNIHRKRKALAASVEDRAIAAAPVGESVSVKAAENADATTTTPPSLSGAASLPPVAKSRTAAQQANDVLIEALRQAFFTARKLSVPELGKTDYGNYLKRAKELVDGGVQAADFFAYVEYWHKAAVSGGWTLTLNSLTSNGRMADYKAFSARGQSGASVTAPRRYDPNHDPAYAPLLQSGGHKK